MPVPKRSNFSFESGSGMKQDMSITTQMKSISEVT